MQSSPMAKRARFEPCELREPCESHESPSESSPNDPTAKTTPFSFKLCSKPSNETFSSRGRTDRHSIEIKLSIPAPDDECPLTLDSIAESRLQFLPDTPFLLDRPLHSKLTLPCGHSFSAMTLVYSFCKNNMTCPCCRAGKDVRVDTQCLPTHFRAQIKSHIQQTLETEHRQDDNSDFLDAVESFSLFGVTIPYEVLGVNGNLTLVANFYDMPASGITETVRPIFSVSPAVQAARDNTGHLTLVPSGPLRALNHIMGVGVNAIQLSMQLAMQGTGNILIDSTPITRLPDLTNNNSNNNNTTRFIIPGSSSSSTTHNSQFQVLVQLHNNDSNNPSTSFMLTLSGNSINGISWNPGTENLEILSSNIQLAAIL